MILFILISIFVVNKQIDLRKRGIHIEKRDECLKFANLINSVYINGPGTEARTKSDYLITTFNSSLISVEDLTNESTNERIAILLSEAGPSTIEFYNKANLILNPSPDWYKVCFEDIGSNGCDSENASWLDSSINNTLQDLVNNLNNYTTIYMESPNMQSSTQYLNNFESWVSQGNSLIFSRHIMCREQSSGTYSGSSYKCNPDGAFNNDVWQILNITLYQRDFAWWYPYNWNVNINRSDDAFNLFPGDKLSFRYRSFVTPRNQDGFTAIGTYRNDTCFLTPCLGDSANQPSIAYWNIGLGRVYYFGDFEVDFINPPGNEFSDTLLNLISVANELILRPEKNSDITCAIASKTYYQQATGKLIIKNLNNVINIQNAL